MTLALMSHGYICPPVDVPGGAQVGESPAIVAVKDVVPVIEHGDQTAPSVALGSDVINMPPTIDHGSETAPPVILGVEDND